MHLNLTEYISRVFAVGGIVFLVVTLPHVESFSRIEILGLSILFAAIAAMLSVRCD